MPIRDGDILTVPSTGDTVANGIKVEGRYIAQVSMVGARVCVCQISSVIQSVTCYPQQILPTR